MRILKRHVVLPLILAAAVGASAGPGRVLAGIQRTDLVDTNNLTAQSSVIPPVAQAWDRLTGGSGDDVFTSVIETADGGYLAVGYSLSSDSGELSEISSGKTDGLVVKFNAQGIRLWDRLIGSTGDDVFQSVVQTADGGYMIAGFTDSFAGGDLSDLNNGGQDGLLVRLDGSGNKVWDRLLGGHAMDRFYSVIQTADGHFVAAGESRSSNSGEITNVSNGSSDGLLVKFDDSGQMLWHQLIGGDGLDFFASVIETTDGLATAGGTYSSQTGVLTDPNNGSQDGLVVKLTDTGVPVWDQVFGGRAYDRFDALAETPDGGLIAAGTAASQRSGEIAEGNDGQDQGLLVRLDALGKPLWQKLIGGTGQDAFKTLVRTRDGNYLAAGTLGEDPEDSDDLTDGRQGAADGLIYHFTGSGDKIWDQIGGGTGSDHYLSAIATTDGSLVMAGSSMSSASGEIRDVNNGGMDGLLVKYYVPAPPVITAQPGSLSLTAGDTAGFNSAASGNLTPYVQWQVQANEGADWIDLEGEIAGTLSFAATLAHNGTSYRAVFQNLWGTAVSAAATLTVAPAQTLDVIAGANRYLTAAAISQVSYATAETAILVQSDNFPDALAASPLAYALKAPILLTETDRLHEVTRTELRRLGAKKVIILGGLQAIEAGVEQTLKADGIAIERIAGNTRYQTAVKVAGRLNTLQGTPSTAVLTSGVSFADALSAGSFAARLGQPVLLTDGSYLTLDLRNYLKDHNITQVTIMGGTLVVSSEVEQQLKTAGITVKRIGGATRVETSANVATQIFGGATQAIAANGWNFPDALAAAPYAAQLNAPILLVSQDSVSTPIKTYLQTTPIMNIKVIGGDLAVDSTTRQQLLEAIIR